MCWPDDRVHVAVKDPESFEGLIETYLQLAYSFDVDSVFLSETNIDFGKFNHLESVIASMTPRTKSQHELFAEFKKWKRRIDQMIIPKTKPTKAPGEKNEYKKTLNVVYATKVDVNKKKYRSVLVIVSTDATGFAAAKQLY
jgi:hypothetical protein